MEPSTPDTTDRLPGDATAPQAAASSHASDPRRRELRRRLKWLRRELAYYLIFLPPVAFVSRLPLGLGRFLATLIANFAYLLARKDRRIALDNLRHAFPDRSDRELRRICRDAFRHVSWTMVEFLIVRRWSIEKIDHVFQLRDSLKLLYEATRNGAVAITAHFGNWEILAGLFSLYHPGHCSVMVRTYSNHRFEKFLTNARRRFGTRILYTDDSPRQIIQVLREKRMLGLLPDQNLRSPNGIFVPFFGRVAYTSTIPVNVARSAKKNVVVCLLGREGKGFRMSLETVADRWTRDRDEDIRGATEAWSRALEERIREDPAQWVWFHDRWHTRPGDEKKYVEHNWARKLRKQRASSAPLTASVDSGTGSDTPVPGAEDASTT